MDFFVEPRIHPLDRLRRHHGEHLETRNPRLNRRGTFTIVVITVAVFLFCALVYDPLVRRFDELGAIVVLVAVVSCVTFLAKRYALS